MLTDMLKELVEKEDKIDKQMRNSGQKIKIIMTQREILQLENIVVEMKKLFDEFIRKLSQVEERIR